MPLQPRSSRQSDFRFHADGERQQRSRIPTPALWLAAVFLTVAVGCPPNTNGGSNEAGGDGGEVGSPDAGPVGTGATIARTVGAEGATIALEGLSLTVPPGALTGGVEIRITSTTQPAPAGYEAYSPVYKFEPEGTTFAKPVTVSIPFTGDPKLARLFWSRVGATGYERIGGLALGNVVTAEVTHFSTGFIANGVDYTDPPDLSCTRTKLLEGRTGQPVSSSVSVFFTVDDCQGRPVTGLTCQSYPGTCDFVLKENGAKLSSEAQATVLQTKGLNVFASLLLDVSFSTQAQLPDLIDGAKAFVNELRVNKGLDVPISIQLFAGEPTLKEWQAPTLDTQLLLQRLDAVATYAPADPSSTNLYGAVIAALQRLAAAEADYQARNYGGAFTAGYVVLFTDGADTAGLKTKGDAQTALAASKDELLVVALQSPDFDANAYQALADMAGSTKVIVSQGASSLYGDFANLAARIAGQTNRTYLLGYCSPKRSGTHAVAVEIANSTTPTSASYDFSAASFQPGCAKTDFDANQDQRLDLCDNKQCGGLGCGGCDDRVASCNSSTRQCVSYCAQQNKCGGAVITNPRGYQQTCNDQLESTLCGTGCVNLTISASNCGACGTICAAGGFCSGGTCQCPPGRSNCNGICTDVSADVNNCGACGTTCATGGFCSGGTCQCPPARVNCNGVCTDVSADMNNCGFCGTTCASGGICSGGSCQCPPGRVNCNGVCTDVSADVNNCGACGNVCMAPTTACVSTMCLCPGGQKLCSAVCTDVSTDVNNCGGCGVTCQLGVDRCVSGQCQTDVEWSRWVPPADAPAATSYTLTTDTVTDTVTGLMWQRNAPSTAYTWPNAKSYCDALVLGGFSDWRLPTLIEFESILNYGKFNPAIDTTVFPGTASAYYWSSSPYAFNTSNAWMVNLGDGRAIFSSVAGSYLVRCAR